MINMYTISFFVNRSESQYRTFPFQYSSSNGKYNNSDCYCLFLSRQEWYLFSNSIVVQTVLLYNWVEWCSQRVNLPFWFKIITFWLSNNLMIIFIYKINYCSTVAYFSKNRFLISTLQMRKIVWPNGLHLFL